ncbi:MAG: hypothetical protein ACK5YR_01365 [Pirellula sp.]
MNQQSPTTFDNLSLRCRGVIACKWSAVFYLFALTLVSGCAAFPDIKHKPQYHNPFPELTVIAILPFRNQSQEPTLSGARVSMAYYNELQSIPGFEVLPVGVVETQLAYFETQVIKRTISTTEDFQNFARSIGADAVLQGAVTDYHAYYPPRMTLKVNWYAANPGLHPIPVGYGLPWGTKEEKNIPNWVKLEAERELARAQIATQTPSMEEVGSGVAGTTAADSAGVRPPVANEVEESNLPSPKKPADAPELMPSDSMDDNASQSDPIASKFKKARNPFTKSNIPVVQEAVIAQVGYTQDFENDDAGIEEPARLPAKITSLESQPVLKLNERGEFILDSTTDSESDSVTNDGDVVYSEDSIGMIGEALPADWPDPNGFIPPRPHVERPSIRPQYDAVISHMKAYNGNDEDFTQALEDYYYFSDDARVGGWQTYLQRSEDFIRFCCHQHIVETLGSRGGQLKSRLNVRWPIYRYVR